MPWWRRSFEITAHPPKQRPPKPVKFKVVDGIVLVGYDNPINNQMIDYIKDLMGNVLRNAVPIFEGKDSKTESGFIIFHNKTSRRLYHVFHMNGSAENTSTYFQFVDSMYANHRKALNDNLKLGLGSTGQEIWCGYEGEKGLEYHATRWAT